MASLSQIASTHDLTEQVYQRLLYAICDGELAPGARLTQEDLAATLGASPSCRRCVCSRRRVLSAMPGGVACGWRRSRRKRSLKCTRCEPSSTALPPAALRRPTPNWTPRLFSRGVGLLPGSASGQ